MADYSLLPSTLHPWINWYNYIRFSATLHSSPKDQLIQLHSFLCYPPLITRGSTDTITFVSLIPSTHHPRINWYNYIRFSATLHSSPKDQLIQLHSFPIFTLNFLPYKPTGPVSSNIYRPTINSTCPNLKTTLMTINSNHQNSKHDDVPNIMWTCRLCIR